MTTPAFSAPSMEVQAIRWSGVCSVILAFQVLLDAGDLGGPPEGRVVELLDLLDRLHELREFLELGPLVVRDADRDVNVDRLDDLGHDASSLMSMDAKRPTGLVGLLAC